MFTDIHTRIPDFEIKRILSTKKIPSGHTTEGISTHVNLFMDRSSDQKERIRPSQIRQVNNKDYGCQHPQYQ